MRQRKACQRQNLKRRGLLPLLLAGLLVWLPQFALADGDTDMLPPDKLETSAGPLTIEPIDHASLVLSFGETTIYVDPVGSVERYQGLKSPTLILITHEHGDHFSVPTIMNWIKSDPKIVAPIGVVEKLPEELRNLATTIGHGDIKNLGTFTVEALPAYNISDDRKKYHPKGPGNGYILTIGGKRIYISGDTEDTQEMRALTNIDIAFIPMNLPYTQTGEQAASGVKAFRPKVVYPFHYGKGGQEPQNFAKAMAGFAGTEIRLRDWYRFD